MNSRGIGVFLAGIGVGISLGLVIFGLAGFLDVIPGSFQSMSLAKRPTISVGEKAPDFALEQLTGGKVRLSDYKNKVVLINFWATWCPPCKVEMPQLEQAAEKYPNDLVVLGVDFEESPGDVSAYVKEMGLQFPILLDSDGKVADLYQVEAFPTTLLVDKQGVIQVVHVGQLMEGTLPGYLSKLGLR